ncbi:hypothetical protein LCGC14_0350030 [marine sediment metagenome]|uniref:Uncharacterized protein n=1 Tax=marine sediment metagenome TaxID=412755 RepID=A0A0F9VYG9_9ZZZZ
MICPLPSDTKPGYISSGDCYGEECAWWDKTKGCCVILRLADIARAIRER